MEWYGAESKSKGAPGRSNDCVLLARRVLAELCASTAWSDACSHFLEQHISSEDDDDTDAKQAAMLMVGFGDVLSAGATVSCGLSGVVKRVVSVHPTGKSAYLVDRNGSMEQEETYSVCAAPLSGSSPALLKALLPTLPAMLAQSCSASSLSEASRLCLAIQGVAKLSKSTAAATELMQSD